MVKKEEIFWVIPGGGNQTSYTCGVFLALLKLQTPSPKNMIVSSGGAANAFYYAARQMKRAEEIWTKEISTKKILNGWRFWRMFNRDAMVDEVFMKKPEELQLKKVKNSPIKILVAVTQKKTGEMVFFSNKDQINLLSLLKATLTVPFFSGIFKDRTISINGKKYGDSRATARYELLVKEAIRRGAKKIIILGGNRSWNYRYFGNFFHNLWLFSKSRTFRKNQKIYEHQQRMYSPPSNVTLLFLTPKKKLKMAPWENQRFQLKQGVTLGYQETLSNAKRIKEFLKS